MNNLVSIIILVFAFLQIILFFKLWGMATDIKKMSMKHTPSEEDNWIKKGQLFCLNGDKEKAFECYKKAFYISISELHNEISLKFNAQLMSDRTNMWNSDYPNIVSYYNKRFERTGFSLNFDDYNSFEKVSSFL